MRVVLLSGGVDSTVALANEVEEHEVVAVTFDYNQTHSREIESAIKIAKHYGVAHRIIRLPIFSGSALTGDKEIPETHAEHVDDTYVPGRNAAFLSVGASIAETVGAGIVVYGANFEDQNGYPDCRPAFIAAFNEMLDVSRAPVWIHAPFLSMDKAAIVRLGNDLDAPLELTWSCYRGGVVACGRCGACLSRVSA